MKSVAPLDKITELKAEGNKLFGEKKYSLAMDVYGAAISLASEADADAREHDSSPDSDAARAELAKVLGNRAECLLQLGRFGDALLDCEAAAALDPRYAKALHRRGRALLGLCEQGGAAACGAAQAALQALREAARMDGGSAVARTLEEEAAARCRREYLLRELEVAIEDEESDGEGGEDKEAAEHVRRLMADYDAKVTAGTDGGDAAVAEDEDMRQLSESKANVDPAYLKFKLRTDRNKSQCIRSALPAISRSASGPP